MAADLTITPADVAVVELIEAITGPEAETLAAGQYARLNTSSGKIEKGKGTTTAEIRKGGIVVKREADGMVTLLRKGTVDVGDALSALTYDDDIFVSDTDGTFADTAGSETLIAATVVPAWTANTPDKLMRFDL